MSDNKKWFKVWASILLDPHHCNLSLENVGRWTRLGALMVSQGNNGRLQIIAPSKALCFLMGCDSFEALLSALKALPNVQIDPPQNDNGAFTVSFSKWFKYQMDSTGYERVKRSRYKRREEKIRNTSTSYQTSPPLRGAASRATPRPLAERPENGAARPEVKSYEEAGDNDLCGPPPGMAERLKHGKLKV